MTARGVALKGVNILITRPKEQSIDLADRLRAVGATIRFAPAIRIGPPRTWKPLDRAVTNWANYPIVVFTSANAVSAVFGRSKKARMALKRPPVLYAIGPKTAAALRDHGWTGARIPKIHEGEALARFIGPVKGQSILIPQAARARDVLAQILRKKGARVESVSAYSTTADPAGARSIRAAVKSGWPDVVAFTSSSTVEEFFKAAGRRGARKLFERAQAASIGPVTSETLRRHGLRRVTQARAFTADGLARAIVAAKGLPHGR